MTFVRPFCAASFSISARQHAKSRLTWAPPGEENVTAELETRLHDFCTARIGSKRKNRAATAACRASADPTHRYNVTRPVQDDVARPEFFSSVHTITLYTTCTACLRDHRKGRDECEPKDQKRRLSDVIGSEIERGNES